MCLCFVWLTWASLTRLDECSFYRVLHCPSSRSRRFVISLSLRVISSFRVRAWGVLSTGKLKGVGCGGALDAGVDAATVQTEVLGYS